MLYSDKRPSLSNHEFCWNCVNVWVKVLIYFSIPRDPNGTSSTRVLYVLQVLLTNKYCVGSLLDFMKYCAEVAEK